MRSDYKVNDELYRIRYGKKMGYYKIKIVSYFEKSDPHTTYYEYIKKGSSKAKRRKLVGKNLLGYFSLFFENKISVLKFLDRNKCTDYIGENEIIIENTDQVKLEIERSKINNAEYWV